MEIRNTEQRQCGNFHAEGKMLPAYIQCWPFDATMCSVCGDVGVGWGPVKTFFFDVLIGWWWDGMVKVYDGQA